MKRIANFEKITIERWYKDTKELKLLSNIELNSIGDKILKECYYNDIKLPTRATSGSAGYDFFIPYDLLLKPNESAKIPTGIRALIEEGWVLKIYPRSSLGFKFKMQINNSIGIIDSDYSGSKNEGHIWIKITNDSRDNKTLELKKGDAFVQGIFVEYGITYDDNIKEIRNGGIGSTNEQ